MASGRVDEPDGGRAPGTGAPGEGPLVRTGLALAEWSERSFPDPFVFALPGVIVVFAGGLLVGERPAKLAVEGGKSFWSLVPFTMQMVTIIVGRASSPRRRTRSGSACWSRCGSG